MSDTALKKIIIFILLCLFCMFNGSFASILAIFLIYIFSLIKNCIKDARVDQGKYNDVVEEQKVRREEYRYSLYSLPKEQKILCEKNGNKWIATVGSIIRNKQYSQCGNDIVMSIPKKYNVDIDLYKLITDNWHRDNVYFIEDEKNRLDIILRYFLKDHHFSDSGTFSKELSEAVSDLNVYIHGELVDPVYNPQSDEKEVVKK